MQIHLTNTETEVKKRQCQQSQNCRELDLLIIVSPEAFKQITTMEKTHRKLKFSVQKSVLIISELDCLESLGACRVPNRQVYSAKNEGG